MEREADEMQQGEGKSDWDGKKQKNGRNMNKTRGK